MSAASKACQQVSARQGACASARRHTRPAPAALLHPPAYVNMLTYAYGGDGSSRMHHACDAACEMHAASIAATRQQMLHARCMHHASTRQQLLHARCMHHASCYACSKHSSNATADTRHNTRLRACIAQTRARMPAVSACMHTSRLRRGARSMQRRTEA